MFYLLLHLYTTGVNDTFQFNATWLYLVPCLFVLITFLTSVFYSLLAHHQSQICIGCQCQSVRGLSVVCQLVISWKLSKIDPQNTIRKLTLLILLRHSDSQRCCMWRGYHPILGNVWSTRHPLSERYRLTLSVSTANNWFRFVQWEGGPAFYRSDSILV